jgi:hypothetical protein
MPEPPVPGLIIPEAVPPEHQVEVMGGCFWPISIVSDHAISIYFIYLLYLV